jgi:hypothetical protein
MAQCETESIDIFQRELLHVWRVSTNHANAENYL